MAADARVIDMSDLKDLAPLAKRLNASTDEFSHALESIQTKLNEFALGVEAWVQNPELDRTVTYSDEDENHVRTVTGQELGYGRLGDGWALLVRSVVYHESLDQSGEWDVTDIPAERERKSLLRCSRQTRVAAVRLIPSLIDSIRAEANNVIEAVEQAKKIADSLK